MLIDGSTAHQLVDTLTDIAGELLAALRDLYKRRSEWVPGDLRGGGGHIFLIPIKVIMSMAGPQPDR